MDMQDLVGQNEVLANMTAGKPVKSYRKTILGKLLLKVWDSMLNSQKEILLSGDPRKDSVVFDVFSEKERLYFERMNQRHLSAGTLVVYTRPEVAAVKEKSYEQYTDEELEKIVNSPHLALLATLNKIDSVAVLFRMKLLAQELEKSDKIITKINARISEVQQSELLSRPKETEEDISEPEED